MIVQFLLRYELFVAYVICDIKVGEEYILKEYNESDIYFKEICQTELPNILPQVKGRDIYIYGAGRGGGF